MTEQTGLMVYTAVFVFTFFAASFLVALCADESPTEPGNFLLLVGASLAWPITLPLAGVVLLLLGIARLASALAGR